MLREVPTISRFYGIVITMYFGDHPFPHIHVHYGDDLGRIAYRSGDVLTGSLPGQVVRLVVEWCELHRGELEDNWRTAYVVLVRSHGGRGYGRQVVIGGDAAA